MGAKDKGIARAAEAPELDTEIVHSLVLKGDLSAMSAEDRTTYYINLCRSLGLNPATQPFAVIRLQGRDVMYPTRGATDQLAAIHRVTRRLIEGPTVRDVFGTKLAVAVCEATHPNGRVETATATLPFADPAMVLMKVETKAKRRATLALLGLGMLDESEIESIPARDKSPATWAPGLAATRADAVIEARETDALPAEDVAETLLRALEDDVAQVPEGGWGVAALAALYRLHQRAWRPLFEGDTDGLAGLQERAAAFVRAELERAGHKGEWTAWDRLVRLPADVDLLPLEAVEADAAALPAGALAVWVGHRAALGALPEEARAFAWRCVVRRYGKDHSIKDAKRAAAELKRALAPTPEPDGDGPRGGRPAPSNDAPADVAGSAAATGDAAGAVMSAEAWEGHLAAKTDEHKVAASLEKRRQAFAAAGVLEARTRTAVQRVMALLGTPSEGVAVNALSTARRDVRAGWERAAAKRERASVATKRAA